MAEPLSPEHIALQEAIAGRYSVESEIGRGGMGIVFLARDVVLNRPVAIKLLPPGLAAVPQSRQRFLQEARTAAGLFHPHIVPIHAVEEHGDLVFYVMAYVPGETLRALVERRGRLDPADAARIFQEVAWALGHAHDHSVVHRDIKPDNILLERDSGRAMVTDFGIARSLEADARLTTTGELVGTPHYMSPEQAAGERVGPPSDIYSLGATVFFALTGRPPFEANNARALLTKHLTEPAPPLGAIRSDLPGALSEVIHRCLGKEPATRFDAGGLLAEALNATRSNLGVVPPDLLRYQDQADRTLTELSGYLVLLGVLVTATNQGDGYYDVLFRTGFVIVSVGLSLVSIGSLLSESRRLLRRGFAPEEIRQSFATRANVLPPSRRRQRDRLLGTLAAIGPISWWWWLGGQDRAPQMFPEALCYALLMVMVALPIGIGRSLARFLLERPQVSARWKRWWAGRLGRGVLYIAQTFLPRRGERRAPSASADATEVLLGQGALAIFDTLPADTRRALHDLPRVIAQLEERAELLRQKENELVLIQAQIGAVGGKGSGLAESRRGAAEEIEEQRNQVNRRLSSVIAALENLRLDLLRLKAGVVTLESITADLDEARRIGLLVDAALDVEQ